jgi:hypothetical protein
MPVPNPDPEIKSSGRVNDGHFTVPLDSASGSGFAIGVFIETFSITCDVISVFYILSPGFNLTLR